jgi:hypothetical protein
MSLQLAACSLQRAGRRVLASCLLIGAGAAAAVAQTQAPRASLPERLTDQEYWSLIGELSEPPGFFRSENLLSNERGYQYVIPSLARPSRQGRVYVGVGPEQNFTYIAALKPKMVFIIDIRRGNLLEHLLYKALFEISADRAEFFSRLFSKPRPRGLDTTTSADSLVNAFWFIETDSALYRKNVADVRAHLLDKRGFGLSPSDVNGLLWVYDHFYFGGPAITYNYSIAGGGGFGRSSSMPSYGDLMVATDGTGQNRAFLATEANWRAIKDLHLKNLIVPVVGDFGGPKAVRAVAKYIKDRGGIVSAYYCSNVEQYLFQDGKAWSFYESVAELPVDSNSVFIRSQGGGRGGFGGASGMSAPNLMYSIQQLVAAHKAGRINYYGDIFNLPRAGLLFSLSPLPSLRSSPSLFAPRP